MCVRVIKLMLSLLTRADKPVVKRPKENRNWEGGSVSKKDLGSLDCSEHSGVNGVESVRGDGLSVDVRGGGRGREGGEGEGKRGGRGEGEGGKGGGEEGKGEGREVRGRGRR